MSYFAIEPDHITEIRRQLQRYVAEHAPRDKRRDWDRKATWPRDAFKGIAEMGLIGLTIPEAYGGMGQDIVAARSRDVGWDGLDLRFRYDRRSILRSWKMF